MNRSFVLKDTRGNACGYLQQKDDVVSCRIKGKTGMIVTLLYTDKSQETHLVSGEEAVWSSSGRSIYGAYVCKDGALLMATGDAACAACKAEQLQSYKSCTEKAENDERLENAQEDEPNGFVPYNLPQRRWPPPPCMSFACYRMGCWTESAPI